MIPGVALVLAALAALLVLAPASSTSADESGPSASAALTFDDPEVNEGAIAVSVRLSTPDGQPIAHQPVDFFVTPDFFGERPIPLRSARTDSQGRATITYVPSWEGAHLITARFTGDTEILSADASATLQVGGVVLAEKSSDVPLSPLRALAPTAAAAVTLIVWLVLALVVVRVGWGIFNAGRRAEATAFSMSLNRGDMSLNRRDEFTRETNR
jgi:hypothetical protein